MGTLERRNSAYQEGPGGLRRTILVQLWAPYLTIMRNCCCTGIRECQAAVFAFEDFLRLLVDQNDFGPRFKHICHSMQVTHGLKLALVDYMAKLVPHRKLVGYVLGRERETIEPAKSLDINWLGTELNRPLKEAMPKNKHLKKIELNKLQNQKTAQLANFELDMTAKQNELKESIAFELKKQFETRKQEFGDEVKVKDLADMATTVCETKLKEFNQQLLDHVNQIKMVADLDVEIFRET